MMHEPLAPAPDPSGEGGAVEPRLLAAEVTARLRDMIVEGDLPPGRKLNERVLCERLHISRTPLREAIKYLASEGLIDLLPHRGAVVRPVTAAAVREMFVVLEALEQLAGELACVHASDTEIAEIRAVHYRMLVHHARGELAPYFRCNQEIHMRVVASAGNATLANTYRSLNANRRRARYMANLSRERGDTAGAEHERSLEALTRRDGALLGALLRAHLENKMHVVLSSLEADEVRQAHAGSPAAA